MTVRITREETVIYSKEITREQVFAVLQQVMVEDPLWLTEQGIMSVADVSGYSDQELAALLEMVTTVADHLYAGLTDEAHADSAEVQEVYYRVAAGGDPE